MSEERTRTRFDDFGFIKLVRFMPYIALVFTAGAWYQTSKANAVIVDKIQTDVDESKTRITRVEDAVLYLKEIVKEDRKSHGG